MERPTWKYNLRERVRSVTTLWWALACSVALFCVGVGAAHAASLTAALDRNSITLGENVTLSLRFEEASPDAPAMPAIDNLQINYVGPSSQFSFINGRTMSSVTHNYIVTPRQVGEFAIPSITATVGGQKLSTLPLKLTVLQPGGPAPGGVDSSAQLAFMKLILPKKEVYVGETIVVVLQLHFHSTVQNFGNFQLQQPITTEGFTVGNNAQGQNERVRIGNTDYAVVPLLTAVTPVKTGQLKIGPISANLVIQLPSNKRGRDTIFDQFGIRDPFGNSRVENRQIILTTDSQTIQCLPLPTENVPADFSGAIGNFNLAVSAGPTNVAVGDPITVKAQITGRGALQSVSLPEQTAWHDFKTYPSTASVESNDPLGLQGTKTFEQIVSPQSTDIHSLPALSFSYFDPDLKSYRTLTQPAVPLSVRPDRSMPLPTIATANNTSQNEQPPVQQDIVPIKQRLGTVAQFSTPLVMQPLFLGVQSVPVIAFLAALIWRKRTDSLANNPRLRRQRKVASVVRDGVNELRRLAKENKTEEFFATTFRLLQEQLGERLDCSASSITEAVIDEQLRPRGVGQSTMDSLHELFQQCNLARYSSVKSSQELAALIPKLEAVLNELKKA